MWGYRALTSMVQTDDPRPGQSRSTTSCEGNCSGKESGTFNVRITCIIKNALEKQKHTHREIVKSANKQVA